MIKISKAHAVILLGISLLPVVSPIQASLPYDIMRLEPHRWNEYKNLRLHAIQDVPEAFGPSIEVEESRTPDYWKNILIEAQRQQNGWMFFAQVDNKLVGMVGAVRGEDFNEQHNVKIVSFYVLPEFRKMGIGKQLFATLLDSFMPDETLTQMILEATSSQEAAINLYEQFDFKKVGLLSRNVKVNDRYYDCYWMEKRLRD